MKFVRECVLLLLLALAIGRPGPALATPTCTGRFANPITDICWRCMLPIRFGGLDLLSMGQEDTPNPGGSPLCACPSQLRVGFKVSFWEPVRRVDVVRRPFCMTSLGGLELDPGFDAPRGSRYSQDSTSTSSFYQVHWYVDPVIFWLEAIFDNACLEQGGFDVAYLTELDPMWHDDELTFILNPEVALFGNLAARAACAADCAAATAGFPLNTLFLVCRLPGQPLSPEWQRAGPYRRRPGIESGNDPPDRQDAPGRADVGGLRRGRTLRLLPAADHGQDRLQVSHALSDSPDCTDCREMLPAAGAIDDPVGRRARVSLRGRGLCVHGLPQTQLLPGRVLRP
jgi:hypothetical protein